jgi:hypothetical protein
MDPISPRIQSTEPTFSVATLREAFSEMTTEYPEREWRLVKAANIVAIRTIEPGQGAGWWVQSECEPDKQYWVFEHTCTCQDYKQRGGPCKHALAVELYQRCERRDAEQHDPASSVIPFPTPTYDPDRDRFELTAKGHAYLVGDDFYTGA